MLNEKWLPVLISIISSVLFVGVCYGMIRSEVDQIKDAQKQAVTLDRLAATEKDVKHIKEGVDELKQSMSALVNVVMQMTRVKSQ